MGVVYKARHVRLNRLVALKMILAGAHASDDQIARFHIEARAVAQIQHPGIVQIHEDGDHDGLPYISLEFVPGGSLSQSIGGMPQPPRSAAEMVMALCRAMAEAHSRGIIHRDLKPANVLLTIDGQPKITDFGLAKQMDADTGQTRSGAIMGTPSYVAPEQAWGQTHEIGPLSDQYALGAILYDMLVFLALGRDEPGILIFDVTEGRSPIILSTSPRN
jgi:serine/threonine-protein kinase